MDARGGGKVQGNVSVVAGFTLPRPQPQKTGGEDLGDLSEPFGGGHQIGVEGVGQNRYLRDGVTPRISGVGSNAQ